MKIDNKNTKGGEGKNSAGSAVWEKPREADPFGRELD